MTSYYVTAPYFINGHKNITGMAIADELTLKIMARCIDNLSEIETMIFNYDPEGLYGLTVGQEFFEEMDD